MSWSNDYIVTPPSLFPSNQISAKRGPIGKKVTTKSSATF